MWTFITTRGNRQETRFAKIANIIAQLMSPAELRKSVRRPKQPSVMTQLRLGIASGRVAEGNDTMLWNNAMKVRRLGMGQFQPAYIR